MSKYNLKITLGSGEYGEDGYKSFSTSHEYEDKPTSTELGSSVMEAREQWKILYADEEFTTEEVSISPSTTGDPLNIVLHKVWDRS